MSNGTYHLFLVDDDEDDIELFADAVDDIQREIKLVVFRDAISVLENLEDETEVLPHAIFLDMNMPLMSGEKCVLKIRNNVRFNSIPIIIYSTSLVPQAVERMKHIGANLYFKKPSSYSQLKSMLYRSVTALLENDAKTNDNFDFIMKEEE